MNVREMFGFYWIAARLGKATTLSPRSTETGRYQCCRNSRLELAWPLRQAWGERHSDSRPDGQPPSVAPARNRDRHWHWQCGRRTQTSAATDRVPWYVFDRLSRDLRPSLCAPDAIRQCHLESPLDNSKDIISQFICPVQRIPDAVRATCSGSVCDFYCEPALDRCLVDTAHHRLEAILVAGKC